MRAIVNPHSSNGDTRFQWPMIEARVRRITGPIEVAFTDGPSAATHLTRRALHEGVEQIIVVGGDGTTNEVVNGFFEEGRLVNPNALLSFLTCGTGGDFRRTFGVPKQLDAQITGLHTGEIRTIDLGKLTYTDFEGEIATRYFANIASFGLSGEVDRAVNHLSFSKRFGGKTAFKWGTLKALFSYRSKQVRICVDDQYEETMQIATAAVCNGRYFGGGMFIAPHAQPDDGAFEVVIIRDTSNLQLVLKSGMIYKGKHLNHPNVCTARGKRVEALPVNPEEEVLLDVDGEVPGRLPATFEVLPQVIKLRC